ncbi:hypothetical protein I5677_04135 [Mobilitalea sibirica]|uniref:Uncharacterized protein n=1 Tax=Mobilitalea sibirica TaxID=1462919 RepID=A0A8J7HCM7_9FIRM|nr:hypothetical protein [Mobilitalea sibirica]MBH1940084.1 hypothetical protein [Mobilitalea sibirica]
MYFQPSKKTYYRFPSTDSINALDSRYYFPDKPGYSQESTRLENKTTNHVQEREKQYDL